MNPWARKRKIIYSSIFIGALVLLVALPLFLIFYEAPTCFDNIKNGKEKGIDCGGKCSRVCSTEFLNPLVLWARPHKIADGIYNLAAYIENPNLEGGAKDVPYLFKMYDQNGIIIAERKGVTYIAPHKNVLVFENAVSAGERIPVRTTFEFTRDVSWEKMIEDEDLIIVSDKKVIEGEKPRAEAVIQNRDTVPHENIDVVIVLYDINENVIAFSKTKIDRLSNNEKTNVFFTWPLPFDRKVTIIEVIPTLQP